MERGKLYVIATPIGNLGDISFRAVEILKSLPFVLAEDTRESIKLFRRYDINSKLISYRDQNHERIFEKVKEKLDMGLNLGLISDSGTPLISDPGFKLVRELRELGYIIESIPGACALISALSISGLPTDRFVFLGFLTKSIERRKDILKRYFSLGNTVIIYESPNRLLSLLNTINDICPKNLTVIARDLTKMREEVLSGSANEIEGILTERGFNLHPHGEYVVMVYPLSQKE